MLAVGAQQIEAVLAAAIRGLERFSRQALIEPLSRSVLIAVVAGVAWRTRSLEWILIAQFAVYLVSMMVRATALRQILPNKRLFDLSGRAEAGTLLRYGGWMWLTALAGVAYTSADRIIVGQRLEPLRPANTIFMFRSPSSRTSSPAACSLFCFRLSAVLGPTGRPTRASLHGRTKHTDLPSA